MQMILCCIVSGQNPKKAEKLYAGGFKSDITDGVIMNRLTINSKKTKFMCFANTFKWTNCKVEDKW